ncbi:hypothetical protein BT69DRAFT_1353394 [Atractiella rhizophila]|nr:hypothetical protein BT69DRAFT_1353394 [Atractiella rhizophila]
MAASWKNLTSKVSNSFQSVDLSGVSNSLPQLQGTGNKFTKQWQSLTQSARETLGTADELTELPEDYKLLERRVDSLKDAHAYLLKVTKVYDSSSYDYPTNLGESASQLSQSITHNLSFWANAATKGTSLPSPTVADKPVEQKKTLPHALSRAAGSGAMELGGQGDKLGLGLQAFALAQEKIGDARMRQDMKISQTFNKPWMANLNQSIQAALKSRAAVKAARVSLDAARTSMKGINNGDPRIEQARLDVEAAEEKLVNTTEEAISLMRSVLESPDALKALSRFVDAQYAFYQQAADDLKSIQGEIDSLASQAEADFRKSRS